MPDFRLKQKIKSLKEALNVFCKSSHTGPEAKVRSLRKEKEWWDHTVENKDLSDAESLDRAGCLINMISAEKENCSMLQQCARFRWALEGDENYSFFHAAIKYRNQKNNIRGLQVNGSWSKSPMVIKAEAGRHFINLFKEPVPKRLLLVSSRFTRIQHEVAVLLESPSKWMN